MKKSVIIIITVLCMVFGLSITSFASDSQGYSCYYSWYRSDYNDNVIMGFTTDKSVDGFTFAYPHPTSSNHVVNGFCVFSTEPFRNRSFNFSDSNISDDISINEYVNINYPCNVDSTRIVYNDSVFYVAVYESVPTLNQAVGFNANLVLDSAPAGNDFLYEYIYNGCLNGSVNKPGGTDIDDLVTEKSFRLKGFSADTAINATWTGTSLDNEPLGSNYDLENAYVSVQFGYSLKTAPGQVATTAKYGTTYNVSLKFINIPWSDVQHTDDTLFLRYMQLTPVVKKLSTGDYIKGASSTVWYDSSGKIEKISGNNVNDSGIFETIVPIPNISVDSEGYGFGFNNSTDEYYMEVQGRWYSVDDIELYKENLMWKYKYSSIIKSDLSTWISYDSHTKASGSHDFKNIGQSAFREFMQIYPVDSRTYAGGTNGLGNYFSGYSDALSTLKMLLNEPSSLYNGVEVYIRYYYFDESGIPHYGKWCHWYDNLASAGGSSGSSWDDSDNLNGSNQSSSGLTDEDKENLESSGNSKNDPDAIPSIDSTSSDALWDWVESLVKNVGDFPQFMTDLFGFLPPWLIALISISIGMIVILRFLGR